jgi:hypothetical protein
MNNITINTSKKALEITKDFQKQASIYGSEAYNELKAAKADFPTYRVSVKLGTKRKYEDRITLKDMKLYIENHDADGTRMLAFNELHGVSLKDVDNNCEAVSSAKMSDIKKWFFITFPELAERTTEKRQKRINQIIAEAEAKAATVSDVSAVADEAASA